LQQELAAQVIMEDRLPGNVCTVAGIDVAYEKDGDRVVAAVAMLDAHTLYPIEIATHTGEVSFPYIPSLFSFREMPPVLGALEKLGTKPDLIICDGHGIAHPRRFGLACHIGIITGIPTIGCGKTRLTGEYTEPGAKRGEHSDLIDAGEVIGWVLRTQDNINPVFVSVGHKVSLDTASDWVLRLCTAYRLPETTRSADHAVSMAMKGLIL
jgi:deoxyribonuclease V